MCCPSRSRATVAVPASVAIGRQPGGYASAAPVGMRATFQLAGGAAGRSQANAPEARRWLELPPPALAITSPAITTRARTPTAVARLRVTAHTPPSLLQESWGGCF